MIVPSAQMSVLASTRRDDRICSGAMYCGDPMTVCVSVSPKSGRAASIALVAFEMPKSRTLMHGEPSTPDVRKRFDGLMSRCTMPSACASASASQVWST